MGTIDGRNVKPITACFLGIANMLVQFEEPLHAFATRALKLSFSLLRLQTLSSSPPHNSSSTYCNICARHFGKQYNKRRTSQSVRPRYQPPRLQPHALLAGGILF